MMVTDAVGYTRVSQSSDVSIDRQKTHIREYVEEHGFELLTIYDDGERASAFDGEREEFQRLCGEFSNGIDAFVVNSKRRLARDFDEIAQLILDCREHGVQIHTHQSGHIDVSKPMQAAMEMFQAASDHKSKKAEIDRARRAVEERQDRGCFQGKPPFGLQFAPDDCHLERDPEQWAILEEIIDRRNGGEYVEDLADELGVSTATVSRVPKRGVEWYEERLDAYGK